MSFTLSMSGVIVGRSELETRDASRKVASGTFRPGLGYELAQPIFALYDEAGVDADFLARYRNARDALRLELTDSSGARVSVRDVHIRGATNSLVIEIQTDDPAFWTSEGHHQPR